MTIYITTIDDAKSLRPGSLRTYALKQFHGLSPKGDYVCTVLQANGFYTVIVISPSAHCVTSSAVGNLTLEKALAAGEHFLEHESVNINVGWYYGGDKVTDSSMLDLDEYINSSFVSKHHGKNIRRHNDGYFFIEGDYPKFNTAWSCVCWLDEKRRLASSLFLFNT